MNDPCDRKSRRKAFLFGKWHRHPACDSFRCNFFLYSSQAGRLCLGRAKPLAEPHSGLGCPTPLVSRAGFSLVELLVVTLIIVVLTMSIGWAIARALAIEQNYREEAGVRSALAHQLAYAERYFSLATDLGSNGNDAYTASYPPEVGGISWETNHWIRVSEVEFGVGEAIKEHRSRLGTFTNRHTLVFNVTSDDPSRVGTTQQVFSADGFLYDASGNVTHATVQGTGPLRRLVIQGEFPIRAADGSISNVSIQVSRPIRLWNK